MYKKWDYYDPNCNNVLDLIGTMTCIGTLYLHNMGHNPIYPFVLGTKNDSV